MLPPLIRGVEYDAEKKALTVHFQVGSYQYASVPAATASQLQQELATDKHSTAFFDARIEGKFKSLKEAA